jgi:octaprenyl-diphosphate synthase
MTSSEKQIPLKARIMEKVGQDLADIEAALEKNLTPYLDLVRETARHILFAGGKRIRPLLALLSSRVCGSDSPSNIAFSTIFEYLHTATLLHDDLVDGALLRRGKRVAHLVFGNETAILTGDFLLARALTLAAATGNPEIIKIIAEITEEMSQGEIEQLHNRGRLDLSETEYMEVIRRKTAVLIQGACHAGALLAGAPEADAAALKSYGFHLGIAFQMADDLLDYTADPRTLGKAVGTDLKEGKLTLPVIFTLAAASREDRDRIARIFGDKNVSANDFKAFVGLLDAYGGISHTQKRAEGHVASAKAALSRFSGSNERELLENIADYALLRRK